MWGLEVVPYIVDIKKKKEIWKQQRRGNSFSKCANAEPSYIKLRLKFLPSPNLRTNFWIMSTLQFMARSRLQDFSGPFSRMHESRLHEIVIARLPREFQIAPTRHITPEYPGNYG